MPSVCTCTSHYSIHHRFIFCCWGYLPQNNQFPVLHGLLGQEDTFSRRRVDAGGLGTSTPEFEWLGAHCFRAAFEHHPATTHPEGLAPKVRDTGNSLLRLPYMLTAAQNACVQWGWGKALCTFSGAHHCLMPYPPSTLNTHGVPSKSSRCHGDTA